MALGLLSIETPRLWQGPSEETEEKGLWEREFPSRQNAGQQQVSAMSTQSLEGALRSAPGRGLVVRHDRGWGWGWQERDSHETTGQTRATPQSITFPKRFGGVGTTFTLKQTLLCNGIGCKMCQRFQNKNISGSQQAS